jgi:hypothetical protein
MMYPVPDERYWLMLCVLVRRFSSGGRNSPSFTPEERLGRGDSAKDRWGAKE